MRLGQPRLDLKDSGVWYLDLRVPMMVAGNSLLVGVLVGVVGVC